MTRFLRLTVLREYLTGKPGAIFKILFIASPMISNSLSTALRKFYTDTNALFHLKLQVGLAISVTRHPDAFHGGVQTESLEVCQTFSPALLPSFSECTEIYLTAQ